VPLLAEDRINQLDLIDVPTNQMDQHVELALTDLLDTLPKGSILRVDNDELGLFS
jgi:hypothetical protein